jgi:hypothetical protein
MSEPLPPAPSPRPPNPDAAPLSLDKTPSHFPVTAEYVKRKMADAGMSPRWVPKKRTPLWAALAFGVLSSAGPVLLAPAVTWQVFAGSVMLGLSTGLATFFGMTSSGPKL